MKKFFFACLFILLLTLPGFGQTGGSGGAAISASALESAEDALSVEEASTAVDNPIFGFQKILKEGFGGENLNQKGSDAKNPEGPSDPEYEEGPCRWDSETKTMSCEPPE